MKHSNPQRRSRSCPTPLTATAVGAALLISAFAAQAQDATQTVTVTGIRKGIEDAISVKRNSDSIVEAISAEDIGKLPDTSVAESVARLPGLTAQRSKSGRAQQISIRGMAPDFGTALLNGREQVSTGDSRGVEFDQYPSELLSGVVVYKTPDAGLVGQGLSGTVNLQTVRPLDFGSRVIAANYRKQRSGVGTGLDEGTGDRMSFSYIDQFADRTIGVALGFARLNENGAQSSRYDNWGGWTPDTAYDGGTVKVPGGFASWIDQTKQTREGAMAVLQFKPNKNFESVLDVFHSTFDQDKSSKGFQSPTLDNSGYDPAGVLSNATIVNGFAASGTVNLHKGIVRNDTESNKDELWSIGWNNKLKVAEWTAMADLSTSTAKRTGGIMETTAGLAGNTPNASLGSISWTGFNGTNFGDIKWTPSLNYSDRAVAKLTDVEGWGGGASLPQAGYSKLPHVKDELNAVRLSAKRDLDGIPWVSAVDLGLNYTDRSKTREYVEGRLVIPGGDPYGATAMPGSGTMTVSGIPIAVWDPRGSVGSVYQVASKLVRDIANKDWTVNEKVTTAYVKADLDSTLFGLPVRGNAGVQIVGTDQSSRAYNVDGGPCPNDVCPVTNIKDGTSYTDVLPSANLAFDLGNEQTLRVAAARVMARPTMSDMRGSLGFGVDNANTTFGPILTGSSGNPHLKPFRANALDISYEKYFGKRAYFGVAGFYKELSTYILTVQGLTDYKDFVNAGTPLPTSGPNAGKTIGLLTKPVNGSGGNISGIELSASLPFNMLTKALDGFGVEASYSDTASSINLATAGVQVDNIGTSTIPLPGLSKQVSNIALYYERSGFSARVAQRYRSDFVGEVSDFTGDRKLTYIKAETVTDLQLGYEFQSGPIKGLSILLQALNVGNSPYIRYKDTYSNEVEKIKFGRTYLFGVNYKL